LDPVGEMGGKKPNYALADHNREFSDFDNIELHTVLFYLPNQGYIQLGEVSGNRTKNAAAWHHGHPRVPLCNTMGNFLLFTTFSTPYNFNSVYQTMG
jgi:hypothetical protein